MTPFILFLLLLLLLGCENNSLEKCPRLAFRYNKTITLDWVLLGKDFGKALEFHPDCQQWIRSGLYSHRYTPTHTQTVKLDNERHSLTQPQCLNFNDEETANIMLSSLRYLKTSEDILSKYSPRTGRDLLENSYATYDAHSQMYIYGVGKYKGPDAIGNYKAIPHQKVGRFSKIGLRSFLDVSFKHRISSFNTKFVRLERWSTEDYANRSVIYTDYLTKFYPCSAIIQSEEVALPDFTLKQFSAVGTGKAKEVCRSLMVDCVGSNRQFKNYSSCVSFMDKLPHHDPKCAKKFKSPYALQGRSFMCKFLHHFMAQFDPAAHCFHSGPERRDRNGHIKCSDHDCADGDDTDATSRGDENLQDSMYDIDDEQTKFSNSNSNHHKPQLQSSCPPKEFRELTAALVFTTFHCLPSLNTQKCTVKCLQAINTYLGRFLQNGVACRCRNRKFPSRLLTVLEIGVKPILSVCQGDIFYRFENCFDAQDTVCLHPNEYLSESSCKKWDWMEIEEEMLNEWDKTTQWNSRITTSVEVASAECFTFSYLLSLKNNLVNVWHITKYISDRLGRENVYFHPSSEDAINPFAQAKRNIGSTYVKYKDVVEAMKLESFQFRSENSIALDCCIFGGWSKLHQSVLPITFNLNTIDHTTLRNFLYELLPSLSSKKPFVIPRRKLAGLLGETEYRDGVSSFSDGDGVVDYEEWLENEIAVETTRLLFGRNPVTMSQSWHVRAREYVKTTRAVFYDYSYHRLHGNTLAVAMMEKRRVFEISLKELYGSTGMNATTSMNEKIQRAGLNLSVDNGFRLAANIMVTLPPLYLLVKKIVNDIRKDPCFLLPKWEHDRNSFVLEYLRLHNGVTGFRARNNSKTSPLNFFSISTANIDEDVFTSPLEFNPGRGNLEKILTFNGIQGDLGSFRRRCPAHDFNVKAILALVPHFLHEFDVSNRCFQGKRVMAKSGVGFRSVIVELLDGKAQLEVYRHDANQFKRANGLFIAVHGFPGMPQNFAPLFGELKRKAEYRNYDFWAPVLPGLGGGNCTFLFGSRILTDLVLQELKNADRKIVYLVGHDVGSILLWEVVDALSQGQQNEYKKLKGFISLATAHPIAQQASFSRYAQPFLSSLNDAYFAANEFEEFTARFSKINQKWWNQEWEHEHQIFWRKTGMGPMTCYYKDNIEVRRDGSLALKEPSRFKDLRITTNVLLLGGKDDIFTGHNQFVATMKMISKSDELIGKYVKYEQVKDTNHFGLLIENHARKRVADEIAAFCKTSEYLGNYFTLWSWFYMPVTLPVDQDEYETASGALIVTAAILLLVIGFSFELVLHPTLQKLINSSEYKKFYEFALLMSAPIMLSAYASKSWILAPLLAIAVFSHGFPEISSRISFLWNSENHNSSIEESHKHSHEKSGSKVLAVLSALGYVSHHFGVFIIYGCVVTRVVELHQLLFAVIAGCLQHAIGFVWLYNTPVYAILMAVLEIWGQMEVYFLLPQVLPIPFCGLVLILTGHYLTWACEILQFLLGLCHGKTEEAIA